jgi:hypothetical protein
LDSAGTGYVYAGDNPVNEVDPSGKDAVEAIFVNLLCAGIVILTALSLAGAVAGSLGTIAGIYYLILNLFAVFVVVLGILAILLPVGSFALSIEGCTGVGVG